MNRKAFFTELTLPVEVDSNFKIILTLCPLVFVSKPQQLRPTLHTSIDKLYSFYYNSNSKFLFVTELTKLLYLTGVKPTFTLSRISHKVTNGQSNTITAKCKELVQIQTHKRSDQNNCSYFKQSQESSVSIWICYLNFALHFCCQLKDS